MKNILVSGAHGFIGGYVVNELLMRGYKVIAFDHHQSAAMKRGWGQNVEVFLGDMRDEVAVTEAMAHADGFIHLAAVLGTQETILNPRPAASSNVIGGLNFLEAAAQYNVPGVYICVGNHWMNNTYSITKTAVERFVYMFNKDRNTRVNNVRVVNAYGPKQLAAAPYGPGKVRKITPAFICRALTGDPVEVYGDGEQVSDMVHVADVARTLVNSLEAANNGIVFDHPIEIGPSEHNTVRSVAELVVEIVKDLTGVESEIVFSPMRPGEVAGDRVTADNSTLDLVGIDVDSLIPLRRGMEETIKWFIDNKGVTWHEA